MLQNPEAPKLLEQGNSLRECYLHRNDPRIVAHMATLGDEWALETLVSRIQASIKVNLVRESFLI